MPAAASLAVVARYALRHVVAVITCRRSPNSETRQRSSLVCSRSAARCGWSTMNSSRCPPCCALDPLGLPSATSSPADHEAQAIALLRFFQIMGRHQDRRARIRQLVDHAPEGAPGQRIDARGRLVQKEHARLVHDRRAKGHALLPSARQAAGDLIFFAFQPRKRQHPALLFFALALRALRKRRRRIPGSRRSSDRRRARTSATYSRSAARTRFERKLAAFARQFHLARGRLAAGRTAS